MLAVILGAASVVRGCVLEDAGRVSAERSFKGYVCTQDCSGHKAGYEWARRKGISDPARCGGKSQSFIEGCMAYAKGD